MYKYLILLTIFSLSSSPSRAQTLPAGAMLIGGVGVESEAEMRAREKDFNTKFLFTAREGDWVADVALKVTGARGNTVIDQSVAAPIVLARLPAGYYAAAMTYQGNTQTRRFRVGSQRVQVVQGRWKRSANDGPSMLR
jgi:hypothetical protein